MESCLLRRVAHSFGQRHQRVHGCGGGMQNRKHPECPRPEEPIPPPVASKFDVAEMFRSSSRSVVADVFAAVGVQE